MSSKKSENLAPQARDYKTEPETAFERKWREDEKLRREGRKQIVTELILAANKVGSSFVTVRALEKIKEDYIKADEQEVKKLAEMGKK